MRHILATARARGLEHWLNTHLGELSANTATLTTLFP